MTDTMMTKLSGQLGVAAITGLLERAVRARAAIDAMANSRLQAEQWWLAAGTALRGTLNDDG